jgi:hypothetical protein
VRTDGWQWYTRICENVIWDVQGWGIELKQINDVENNVIVNCKKLASIAVSRGRIPPSTDYGCNVRRNILVQYERNVTLATGAVSPFYDDHSHLWEKLEPGASGRLQQPAYENNLLYCPDRPQTAVDCLEKMRALGKEASSLAADPGFIELEAGDFHLSQGSPAFKLGIRSIERWGLVETVGPRCEGQGKQTT